MKLGQSIRQGMRDLLLEFWDSLNYLWITVQATNVKFCTVIGHEGF